MKKQGKRVGIGAIILILFLSILGFTNRNIPAETTPIEAETDGEVLMTAFEASEAELDSTRLNFWSQIRSGDYSLEEMKKISLDFAKELGVDKDTEIEVEQGDDYNKVMITAETQGGIFISVIMDNYKLEDDSVESYLLVDAYLGEEQKDISQMEGKIMNYFEKMGFEYEYSMTLIGTFSNKMDIDIMRGTIQKSFTAIEAKVLEGIEESEYGALVSLSGYSPKVQNNIQLSGRKMNINAAMRYSEYDQKTYLWIGSPLIATEY